MNKKQTIRKLGSIEAKQTIQPKQKTSRGAAPEATALRVTPKNKVLEIESDEDIENY